MSTFETVSGILFHAVSYMDTRQKNKMIKSLQEIWQERDDENDKPSWEERDNYPDLKLKDFRDNNVLDRNERKLFQLGEAYNLIKNGGADLRSLIKG